MYKIYAFIFSLFFCSAIGLSQPSKDNLKGHITISGAFALYPMAVKWAEEFRKLHPQIKIDISAGGAGKGMTDVLSKVADLGMVSRDINPEEVKKGAYSFAVTKDAVLVTLSASNPKLKEIMAIGLKKSIVNDLWITGKIKTWGQVLSVKSTIPIHVYTRSDACGAGESWAKYLQNKQEDLLGIGVFGDPGLAQAVMKDPLGIGYNNLCYAFDPKTKQPLPGIKVAPFDLNSNGKIDIGENFYGNMNQLMDAIAAGKYPSPPARDLYFVTSGKPTNKIVIAFLNWILTDGQKFVREAGFVQLTQDKLNSELKKLK